MDLEVLVQEARLWNRDPGPQSDALIKRLRAENGETIIDLYEQALQKASHVFLQWESRPEPRALFEARMAAAESGPFDPQKSDPTAPPFLGRQPEEPEPYSYEQWLRGWCLYQVLVGNVPPPEGHFLDHPDRPAVFDFFMGMIGNAFPHDFQEAYERSTDTLWPLAPGKTNQGSSNTANNSSTPLIGCSCTGQRHAKSRWTSMRPMCGASGGSAVRYGHWSLASPKAAPWFRVPPPYTQAIRRPRHGCGKWD